MRRTLHPYELIEIRKVCWVKFCIRRTKVVKLLDYCYILVVQKRADFRRRSLNKAWFLSGRNSSYFTAVLLYFSTGSPWRKSHHPLNARGMQGVKRNFSYFTDVTCSLIRIRRRAAAALERSQDQQMRRKEKCVTMQLRGGVTTAWATWFSGIIFQNWSIFISPPRFAFDPTQNNQKHESRR